MNNQLLSKKLHQILTEKQRSGLYRKRVVSDIQDHDLNFSSNDYLSLSRDPRLINAYQTGYERFPVSSGGSAVVSGYYSTHQQLERAFAEALHVDDALYFSSGYAANLSLMKMLAALEAVIYLDKAIHASFYDGVANNQVKIKRYRHIDMDHLKNMIDPDDPGILLTESIFSMSGQYAPLNQLQALANTHAFELMVDEAHAFGVVGKEGLGLVHALKLTQNQVPLRVIPLGKAFASAGAIIAGQKDWIDLLLQSARPYIYSTAPSPALAYGLLHTLDVVRSAEDRRDKLDRLIHYFRGKIKTSSLTWRDSMSPIQQLQLGCPYQAQALSEVLLKKGIMCYPMRQPTVTKQETGLRVILNYNHQPEDVDRLFKEIEG